MDTRPFLTALANVGIAMFMFVVGLELNQSLLRGQGRLAATVSLSSIVLPFGLGAILALQLVHSHPAEHRLGFVLFMGAAMSVTAFPVLARILTDRGMLRTKLGGLALTCAAADDVLAWSMLAVVVTLAGDGGTGEWLTALLPLYAAVMFWVVRPLLRRIMAASDRSGTGVLTAVLVGVLVSGAVTELIGLHFLFGAIVPRQGTQRLRENILDRVQTFNTTLLLPVFFIVAWLNRLPVRESAALATLMNTRELTELIILSVGLQMGVLDQPLYSLMVVMAVVTTAMAGPLLSLIYPPAFVARDQSVGGVDPSVELINARR